MIEPRTVKQAETECRTAWEAHPEAIHGWCVHHDTEMEALSEPIVNRIRYIVENKDEDERVVRLDNLRPVLSIKAVAAWKAYEKAIATAQKAYEEVIDPVWEAYDEARTTAREAYEKAKAPAWKAYEKATAPAWKAYEKAWITARKVYEEAIALAWEAYEKAIAPAHKHDVPNHTWNGKSIFQKG